jgi:hypothetical protein
MTTAYITGWGQEGGQCVIVANGDRFWKYRDRYRLASGCMCGMVSEMS